MGTEEKGSSRYRRLGFVSGYVQFKALRPDVVTEEDDVGKEGSAGSCPSEKSVKVGAAWEVGVKAGENIAEAKGKAFWKPSWERRQCPRWRVQEGTWQRPGAAGRSGELVQMTLLRCLL